MWAPAQLIHDGRAEQFSIWSQKKELEETKIDSSAGTSSIKLSGSEDRLAVRIQSTTYPNADHISKITMWTVEHELRLCRRGCGLACQLPFPRALNTSERSNQVDSQRYPSCPSGHRSPLLMQLSGFEPVLGIISYGFDWRLKRYQPVTTLACSRSDWSNLDIILHGKWVRPSNPVDPISLPVSFDHGRNSKFIDNSAPR